MAIKFPVFCIYTEQEPKSYQSFVHCVQSAKKFNIEVYDYKSVWKENTSEVIKELNLFSNFKSIDTKKTIFTPDKKIIPSRRLANGLTHYKLYQKCVQLKTPIVILEHDAFFVGPLPEHLPENLNDSIIQISSHLEFQMTVVSTEFCWRSNQMRKYGKTQKPYRDWSNESGIIPHPLSGTNGTSGYIIGPNAAQSMIDYVRENGIANADRLREDHIGGKDNLYLQVPQSVHCNHYRW